MINVNLLPWREALRKELLKEFLFVLSGFAVIVVGCMVMVHLFIHGKIRAQQALNSYLQQEIILFNQKIQAINHLQEEKDIFTKRMAVIQMLQGSRPQVVHLFDELVSMLPDGIYLTRIKRTGNKVSIYGRAESNSQISTLMRKVEASSWLAHPALEEIKKPNRKNTTPSNTKKKDTLSNFKLTMEQMDKVHGS